MASDTRLTSGAEDFPGRFKGGDTLLGTFVKTPTVHAIEILGHVKYDFVVIDEEHAPIDRAHTDAMLLACRAWQIAGIVRVSSHNGVDILRALDAGAAGILVPHVNSVARAKEVVAASRYRPGTRGFSNSPRAGDYGGVGLWDHAGAQDRSTLVIAMIEDREALDEIEAIVAVTDIAGVFIGRGDLTVSLGAENMNSPEVREAVDRIIAAATAASKTVCIMVGSAEEARAFRERGVNAFIVSSDQGFMRMGAAKMKSEFQAILNDA